MTTALSGDFPDQGATGMMYTMASSAGNFGRNLFIQTAILKKIPWKGAAMGGLIIQFFLIVLFIPKIMDKINTGETTIDL